MACGRSPRRRTSWPSPTGKDRTAEMPGRSGNPRCFRAAGHLLGKFPEFCEA